MTDKQHPDQFDWATELSDAQGHVTLSKQEAKEIGARLHRLHAESEMRRTALLDEMQKAARLGAELETLRAKIKTMAEEHADELMVAHLDGRMRAAQPAPVMFNGLTEEETMETASCAGLMTQPAGAQQPGTAYAALSDAEIDRIVPALESVSEDFPAEWAVWKDRERIRKELRASHGQAPATLQSGEQPLSLLVKDIAADLATTPIQVCMALSALGFGSHSVNMAVTPTMDQALRAHFSATEQAAPAAVAVPRDTFRGDTTCLVQSIIALLELDADGALVPHGIGGHARALLSAAASRLAAPTTKPAPQQEASPTTGMNIAQRILHVGGRNNAAGYVEFGSIKAVEALVRQVLRDLPAAPQPLPASQGDALDAARLDWLALAGPTSICVVIDRPHDGEVEVSTDDVTGYGKTLREALDKAREQGGA